MSKPPRRWVLEALVLSSGRRAVFGYGSAVLMSCWGADRAESRASAGRGKRGGCDGLVFGRRSGECGWSEPSRGVVGGLEGGRGGQAGGQTQDDGAGGGGDARGGGRQQPAGGDLAAGGRRR